METSLLFMSPDIAECVNDRMYVQGAVNVRPMLAATPVSGVQGRLAPILIHGQRDAQCTLND